GPAEYGALGGAGRPDRARGPTAGAQSAMTEAMRGVVQ
ncbi:MAG: hypothetical protein H6R40_855, partial [Gemmatimonadetes bacterium]|nr:hypothetical protein [Gemmatimonadota bacterium]